MPGLICQQLILVLHDVGDAPVEVGDGSRVLVPRGDVVIHHRCSGAIDGGEVILGDVTVVAPAAELVAVVHSYDESYTW